MKLTRAFFDATARLSTPFIVYDLETVKKNYQETVTAFPGANVFYAMKANAHPFILQTLAKEQSGFEVASLTETKRILTLGVPAKKIMCLHPIKSPVFLRYLQKQNIDLMAVDCFEEVDKVARFAPNAKLIVRITVDNTGSGWALNGKFGLDPARALSLFTYIAKKNLTPYGLTFHVGSQCFDETNWQKAIRRCADVWRVAKKAGISLQLLSLGGGLAVKYNKPAPRVSHTGALVIKTIKQYFPDYKKMDLSIEPGRAIVATAGTLVTSVVGTATRGKKEWLYIDTGTYNGLVEAIETPDRQFYPIVTQKTDGLKKNYSIGGPSCVTLDTPFEHVTLPNMLVNERLYIQNCGAYTTACAAAFNGFPIPKEYIWEDLYANNA